MARAAIQVRLSLAGITSIDQMAEDEHSNRSEVIRALLAEALKDDRIVKAVRARLKLVSE